MSSYHDAVFSACKYGRMEDIDDLLKDSNAKWNVKDELGNSPLHYAASTLARPLIPLFLYSLCTLAS